MEGCKEGWTEGGGGEEAPVYHMKIGPICKFSLLRKLICTDKAFFTVPLSGHPPNVRTSTLLCIVNLQDHTNNNYNSNATSINLESVQLPIFSNLSTLIRKQTDNQITNEI